MNGWPKTIYVKGVGIPVENWEELDQLISRYGVEGVQGVSFPADSAPSTAMQRPGSVGMQPTDRALLQSFVEAGSRGVLSERLGQALGKRGKGVRNALDSWSRRIGLVTTEGTSAFEPVKRFDGRGFRMLDHYLEAARDMLGRETCRACGGSGLILDPGTSSDPLPLGPVTCGVNGYTAPASS